MVEEDRVGTLPFAQPHNDSLPGIRSVMDAMESRGGVLSSFKESPNRRSVIVFKTMVGAAENPIGTMGLNRHATTPKAITQRYSPIAAAWNMTTAAPAATRICSPAWYPTAWFPRNTGSKRPPSRAALAIHFMNVVSIESSVVSLLIWLEISHRFQPSSGLRSRGLGQPRQPHSLRALICWRTVATKRQMPATKSTVTATARYFSIVSTSPTSGIRIRRARATALY